MDQQPSLHVFDPRKLILPPFSHCPVCGANEFGVYALAAGCNQCRSCMYSQNIDLPKIKKHIIYLDQFVVSDFLKALDPSIGKTKIINPSFLELYKRLDRLVSMQLIVCPISPIHKDESIALRDRAHTRKLQTLFERLSCGVSLEHDWEIKRRQIWKCLQSWLVGGNNSTIHFDDPDDAFTDNPHEWTKRLPLYVNWIFNDETIAIVENSRNELAEKVKVMFERWQQQKNINFKAMFNAEIQDWPLVALKDVIQRKETRFTNYVQGTLDIDNLYAGFNEQVFDMVQEEICNRPDFDPDKIDTQTALFYKSPELRQAPFLRIGSFLFTHLTEKAASGQINPPDSGTINDFNAVAAYGAYCDAMFVDKGCYELTRPRSGCATGLKAKIFSMSNKQQFFEYLDGIENAASADHLTTFYSMYGEEYLQPYTSIFDDTKSTNLE